VDAFFNVYKPKGPTSHDVVARLRRASGVRRIGHGGTLDPLAEGVLVVATGQATRLIEYVVDTTKAYGADVTFGVETDTYDAAGQVVAERSPDGLTRARVLAALAAFRGEIEQRPPSFSAISVGGQRLYALARRGETVVAPARNVTIMRLDLEAWEPPVARLAVVCSKGTYIRSLAHDLGRALGSGAHLSGLVRRQVGRFRAEDATPLAELEGRLRGGRWEGVAVPVEAAVEHLAVVQLDETAARRLAHGQTLPLSEIGDSGSRAGPDDRAGGDQWPDAPPQPDRPPPGVTDLASGTLGGAYAPGGRLLGVVRLDRSGARPVWRPEKVLAG
jgi:tRNA pseudouridine55 synthase